MHIFLLRAALTSQQCNRENLLTRSRLSFRRFHPSLRTARGKKRNLPKQNSAKNPRNQRTIVRAVAHQSHLSPASYSKRNRKPHNAIRGKPTLSRPFFGLASNRAETI